VNIAHAGCAPSFFLRGRDHSDRVTENVVPSSIDAVQRNSRRTLAGVSRWKKMKERASGEDLLFVACRLETSLDLQWCCHSCFPGLLSGS